MMMRVIVDHVARHLDDDGQQRRCPPAPKPRRSRTLRRLRRHLGWAYHFAARQTARKSASRWIWPLCITDWLGELKQLRSIDISHNNISVLPKSLQNLVQLESVNISGNPLTELPKWLGDFSELKSLGLYKLNLNSLPESLRNLRKLTHLAIANNEFTESPVLIKNMNLTALSAWGNSITELPKWIGTLTELEMLDITDNKIHRLPESLGKC
jgi:Leucine-rich repeat (LRR) protein